MKKAVVSVGAGPLQTDFIKRIKQKGYCVVAFGYGKNDPEAIDICDYFNEIDTSDANSAIEWLKSLDVEIVGAGSYAGGVAIRTLQIISNEFHLPTEIDKELVIGMNKLDQQILYEKYKMSNIKTYSVESVIANPSLISSDKNYILKPAVGRGSSGVNIISGIDIHKKIEKQELKFGDMIQEVVYGNEYRVLLMVQNGEIRMLVPVHRVSFENTFYLGRLKVSLDDFEQIQKHALKMIQNIRMTNGIIKYDIIVSHNSVNLIEMDIGVGGGSYYKCFVSHIVEQNLMDTYIDLICGKEIPVLICKNDNLVMDYIYNMSDKPITYKFDECKKTILEKCGNSIILQNQLHPETKGGFASNADFVFSVIYPENEMSQIELNDFVNKHLFLAKEFA